jgi:putative transposase
MARKPRVLEPNRVYHVFNRRTDRQLLFPTPRAFEEFLQLMEEGCERYKPRICTYCVMETHWHQGIWIRERDEAPSVVLYLRWLSGIHAGRFRRRSNTRGDGHVYQDRYKAIAVENDDHYLTLVRYVEANPLAAGLVERAEHWPWSSLTERLSGRRRIVTDGPVSLPPDWPDIVNTRSSWDESEDQPAERQPS